MKFHSRCMLERLVLLAFAITLYVVSSGLADDDPLGVGWPNGTGQTKRPGRLCCGGVAVCCNWHTEGECKNSGDQKLGTTKTYGGADLKCTATQSGLSVRIKRERPWGYCCQPPGGTGKDCYQYSMAACVFVEIYQNAGCGGMLLCSKLKYCGGICYDGFAQPEQCGDCSTNDTFYDVDEFP